MAVVIPACSGVGCPWPRCGRVAAALPACGSWALRHHQAAGCARGLVCSRRVSAHQAVKAVVAPPILRRGQRHHRDRPHSSPNLGFQAGHWVRSGHSPPASVQTSSRTPEEALAANVVSSGALRCDGRHLGPPTAWASRSPRPSPTQPATTGNEDDHQSVNTLGPMHPGDGRHVKDAATDLAS